jgi:tripartite ATP-independent transporter DctP family solute receptor
MEVLRRTTLILWGLAAMFLAGCEAWTEPPVRQLKLSLVTNIDHALYKGAVRFADLVKERTHGKFLITVYPNSQLAGGSLPKEIEMLREGKIDFSFTSNLIYSNLDHRFYISSVPWLFSGNAAADEFFAGPRGREMLDLARLYGVEGLSFGENGFRQITNSRHPIRGPDDLKGLKFRVPSATAETLFRTLGAEPVVMPWASVYRALKDKTIDGQENPIGVLVAFSLYEVQKYVTICNYSYDAYILGINRQLFDSLDRETRDILRDAAREATAYQIRLSRESAREQLEMLKEKGMEVAELTPAQLHAFRERVRPAYLEYERLIGAPLSDALRAADK